MTEKIKLSEIRPDTNNANKGTERGRGALEKSLQELGAGRSILVDKNNIAIAGNKTLEVAAESGFENAIVVETDGTELVVVKRTDLSLDDEKGKQLAIADNRVGELSLEWDSKVLEELSQEVDLSGFFTYDELEELIDQQEEETGGSTGGADNDPPEPPLPGEAKAQLGDIYRLGRHYIACGDCCDENNIKKLLAFVDDRKVNFVWSDPPYGISIVSSDKTVGGGSKYNIPFGGVDNETEKEREVRLGSVGGAKAFGSVGSGNIVPTNIYAPIIGDDSVDTAERSSSLYLATFPKAVQCWWGGNHYASCLPNSSCWVVWDKVNGENNFADAELAWLNQKSAVRIFKHMWNGLLKESEKNDRRVHPTQKPIALAEWIFDKYGGEEDLIIDPFLGSGMSILAAQKMFGDRVVVGFELSPNYIDVIVERYEKMFGESAELVGNLDVI